MDNCVCPKASNLTEISAFSCGVDLSQIQRLAFQRVGTNFDTADAVTPSNINELADWQVFRTATDDTKIVVTPKIGGDPIIEAGDAITTGGGDNSTFNGVEENEGTNPAVFSCIFKSLPAQIERELQALSCESGELVVYFILKGNNIACVEVTAGAAYTGFEVLSMFVSDRNNAGFGTKDTHSMNFSMPAGYSNYLAKIKPNFSPLTQL